MPDGWKIPAPLATAEARMEDGARIIIRRHGNPKGPRIVLSHGNGFSADLYYPFWSLLTDRFDVVIYDIRSHGWNPLSDLQAQNFWTFVNDNVNYLPGHRQAFRVETENRCVPFHVSVDCDPSRDKRMVNLRRVKIIRTTRSRLWSCSTHHLNFPEALFWIWKPWNTR